MKDPAPLIDCSFVLARQVLSTRRPQLYTRL